VAGEEIVDHPVHMAWVGARQPLCTVAETNFLQDHIGAVLTGDEQPHVVARSPSPFPYQPRRSCGTNSATVLEI
jgi:hypothetical protein